MGTHAIRHSLDVYGPRKTLEAVCFELGFPRGARQELAIVVSELCSNIIKYGVRGSVEIEKITDPVHGVGVLIIARDVGRPFKDFATALLDGCDDRGPIDPGTLLTRGGLGIGLGAVQRLSDAIDLEQGTEGKAIRVRRYLRRPPGHGGYR
jgi:anti-sigma regulatory factor (Ser/Thr protein kinase)